MFDAICKYGITRRACEKGYIELHAVNLREYANNPYQTVDDKPYGGGPGMVMMAEPLIHAVEDIKVKSVTNPKVIYVSPQGCQFNQQLANKTIKEQHLIFIAGRYEGIDERAVDAIIDEEWSLGDYIISGGELAVMVMIDSITRMLPGVVGNKQSVCMDSFSSGLLDYPNYTRPQTVLGLTVPDVLMHGNHKKINRWREKQALGRTWERRPDLLEKKCLTDEEKRLLAEYISTHENS